MDKYYQNQKNKQGTIMILAFICFVLGVIAISSVSSFIENHKSRLSTINSPTNSTISRKTTAQLNEALQKLTIESYHLPENIKLTTSIREVSYKETNFEDAVDAKFILDVEELRATYRVSISQNNTHDEPATIWLSCASAEESKFPKDFCIGTEFNSSIDAYMADILPYRNTTSSGISYSLTHETSYQVGLTLSVEAKCNDSRAKDDALSATKQLISSYGLDPEQVPVEIDETACKAYEHELVLEGL